MALLNEHINLICSKNNSKNIYICGDFNVDLLQYDKRVETNCFIDQLYSHGLQPLIVIDQLELHGTQKHEYIIFLQLT